MDSIFCKICKTKNKKLKKLFEKGEELLEEELDIIKIINSIRILNKDNENKFVIDMDEDARDANTSYLGS